jgi:hypothetical protein
LERAPSAPLFAFGPVKDIAKAGLSDLEKTPGLNAATAKLEYDFFPRARRRVRRATSLPERTELTAVVKSAFAGAAAQEILTRSTLDRANFRLCFEPRRATSATAGATVRFSVT